MCKDLNLFARNILSAINYDTNIFIQGWKVTYYFMTLLLFSLIFFDNHRYSFVYNGNDWRHYIFIVKTVINLAVFLSLL